MQLLRRVFVLAMLVGAFSVGAHAGQTAAVAPAASLTAEQMEAFLLKAKILEMRDAGGGVTDSRRAKLSDGTLTHDAHIQWVDISRPFFEAGKATEVNFKDTYRFNIAGYRLARLLELDNVPMSVERVVDGKRSAVTWWVDDVLMDEKGRIAKKTAGPDPQRTTRQIQLMRVFDELIQNRDRNQGNLLWTSDWKMWMIDHTRAFRLGKELMNPSQLNRIDPQLLARMRALTADALTQAMGRVLMRDEAAALLARRDLIVKHYDERIARLGEATVLFTPVP